MTWTALKLTYRAKSPVHIGWHTLGYIQRTRYYISGRAMWGAFTANMTRTLEGIDPVKPVEDHYKKVGKIFEEDVIASYFYPKIKNTVLSPNFSNSGLMFGKISAYEFERRFISSIGQTAVLPETNSAEDGSLHESEFIAHMLEAEDEGASIPVFFEGYLFVNQSSIKAKEIPSLVFSEIFVGGDRKYGWGRLVLTSSKPRSEYDTFFGHELNLQGDHPTVTIKKDQSIPAHLPISENLPLKGDIEPLVGREWGEITDTEGNKKNGAGQKISSAVMCWVPGSILCEEKTFNVCKYGILKD